MSEYLDQLKIIYPLVVSEGNDPEGGAWDVFIEAASMLGPDDIASLFDRIAELEADYGRLQNDNQKYIDKRIAAEAKLDAVRGLPRYDAVIFDDTIKVVTLYELQQALDNS